MIKVGLIGHFGKNENLLDGQTIKTKYLFEALKNIVGEDEVNIIDTHRWKSNPLRLVLKCLSIMKGAENIVILPAHNGVKVLGPLLVFLNKIYKRKLHYVVIGGWLPDLLSSKPKLLKKIKMFNGVYVETLSVMNKLNDLELKNVRQLNNFKKLDVLAENQLIYTTNEPYKLCTFSRVTKNKGIEDAIEAVKNVNGFFGRNVYSLDIYGPIAEEYKSRFHELRQEFPIYINYKGTINFDKSVEVIKHYFALLFPTKFKTEGIPGTIIDSFAAGVPVIVSNWDSAIEIVDNKTGIIYDFNERSKLEKVLFELESSSSKLNLLKKNCLIKAEEFNPDIIVSKLAKYF